MDLVHVFDACCGWSHGSPALSPVSWSHHWVWVAPALLVLHGRTRVVVALVFAVGPHWLLPKTGDRELARTRHWKSHSACSAECLSA